MKLIEAENLSKLYRIGDIGRSSLRDAFAYWWKKLSDQEMQKRVNDDGKIPEEQLGPYPNSIWALKDVSFEVEPGECIAIAGGNGMGKSTLLRILSRLTEPTEGRAVLRGKVTSLLEVGTGFHPDLTGRENVFLNGTFLGMRKKEIAKHFDEIVAFAEIGEFIDTTVKFYSTGMAMRLAFSVAAHLRSDILLLDEMFEVGDSIFQQKCIAKMKEKQKEGRSILFVSHQNATVERLCERILVMKHGKLIKDGKTADLIGELSAL